MGTFANSIIVFLVAFSEERRAIRNFLEGEDEASQFLEHSRRLFSSDLGHLKEAKEG